ncbi:MAG TPA: hypothetical protein VIJ68_02995, partial [Candidatus Saccharimonadales bacterium]
MVDPTKVYEATDALIAGMDGGERVDYLTHLRELYPEQLGPVAISSVSEQTDRASAEALSLTASAAIVTMAEEFSLAPEDFGVLRISAHDGSERTVVAYTRGNGIDLGDPNENHDAQRSWNSIFDEDSAGAFMIEVNGTSYDTRKGMTKAVYDAFIADAKAFVADGLSTDPLPDSPQLAAANDEGYTVTWLTGEEAHAKDAWFGCVNQGGQIDHVLKRHESDSRMFRFRP